MRFQRPRTAGTNMLSHSQLFLLFCWLALALPLATHWRSPMATGRHFQTSRSHLLRDLLVPVSVVATALPVGKLPPAHGIRKTSPLQAARSFYPGQLVFLHQPLTAMLRLQQRGRILRLPVVVLPVYSCPGPRSRCLVHCVGTGRTVQAQSSESEFLCTTQGTPRRWHPLRPALAVASFVKVRCCGPHELPPVQSTVVLTFSGLAFADDCNTESSVMDMSYLLRDTIIRLRCVRIEWCQCCRCCAHGAM